MLYLQLLVVLILLISGLHRTGLGLIMSYNTKAVGGDLAIGFNLFLGAACFAGFFFFADLWGFFA